jgi:hypothetical protein
MMRNRPIFIKIKNYIEAQGYTIQQIENVTPAQVISLLNLTPEEAREYREYYYGIKRILIRALEDKADTQTVTDLKAQIHNWLVSRFPDYAVEKDFNDKKNRMITFYLDGREE